ncbi:hypothetical protein ADL22_32120 [Streptomyces sp. NRRL F-4489]|uniref:DUF1684 domain-containing protein n=1 Tax=Streptomyces sp. NRRL F-4489 TaxID=1609095 RepID=UPI0007496A16|nr:DUF1684 domain-containing protein [Streptomyces sp. NRRL F-4489]KUL33854.1 hypothetical protein ADL22_32120 [Streptomyces sp. NRRL F-4489]
MTSIGTPTGPDPLAERREWERWRAARLAAVTGPYGPLAVTGTHWLADHPGGRIPGLPGHWTADDGGDGAEDGDGGGVVLRAAPGDGLTVDGAPAEGTYRLGADAGPEAARVAHGARRLVVLRREGLWAVRDTDPAAPARSGFPGIEVHDHDARWLRPGLFRPYAAPRTVRLPHADGRERGFALGGELAFPLDADEYTLQVAVEEDGSLWAVLADAGRATGTYRFRFLRTPAPAADGTVPVDLNRVHLPPCAFSDHFLCPLPAPGNTLPIALAAGERNVLVR